jgi:hypothetical protein
MALVIRQATDRDAERIHDGLRAPERGMALVSASAHRGSLEGAAEEEANP